MFLLVFYLLVIFLAVLVIKRTNKNFHFVVHHSPVIEENEQKLIGYKKRFRVMNESEVALFYELRRHLQSFFIFPNMRIADVIDTINGAGFYKRRNKILPKHLDFVICDASFAPILAIELNGSSHSKLDRLEKDKEKKDILNEANLPLVVIKVGDNFSDKILEIKQKYLTK